MKKLSVLTLFLFCAIASFSQGFPNNQSISNPVTLYHARGGLKADVGFVNTRYSDTTAANLTYIAHEPGSQIVVGNTVYVRDDTAVKWIVLGSSGTVIVGGDTTYVQLPLYVDTTGGIRTLKIFHPDGYEGGIVTYTGTGFDFNVSPITLYLNNKVFLFPATTLTLSAPNSEPRYDIFGVDSLGAFVKSGDTAAVPVEPQVGIDSFALTKAFLISPGDTAPNVTIEMIYDETALSPEWPISSVGFIELDSLNTNNPYHLTHDIFISKYSSIGNVNPVITFKKPTANTYHKGDVIQFALYLNGNLGNTSLYFDLLKDGHYAVNALRLENGYVNPNDINRYVLVSIPMDNLTWLNDGTYDAMRIGFIGTDSSGAGGLYLDKIFVQSGIQNIPSSIDYSNKQDSNYKRNDSLFWVAKGIEHFITKVGTCDTCISTVNISDDSTLLYFIRVNGDTARIVDFYGAGGGSSYTLPTASSTVLGGVKVGSGLGIDGDGVLSATGGGSYQLPYNGNTTDYLGGDTAYHPLPITDTSNLSDRIDAKLNISDTASMLSPYQKTITLTTTGTSGAATLTGDSLNIPQYSGGGTTADSTLTMSGGETSVTFSSVPADYSDYSVFYNGMKLIPEDDYTTSGDVITLAGGREAVAGDRINYVRKK